MELPSSECMSQMKPQSQKQNGLTFTKKVGNEYYLKIIYMH